MDGRNYPACGLDVVHGDLNGDGTPDAAFTYVVEGFGYGFDGEPVPGGQGSNIHAQILAALVKRDGRWSIGAQEQVGGRHGRNPGSVTSVSIRRGVLILDRLDYAKTDAMCCPSFKGQSSYRLMGSRLTKVT